MVIISLTEQSGVDTFMQLMLVMRLFGGSFSEDEFDTLVVLLAERVY